MNTRASIVRVVTRTVTATEQIAGRLDIKAVKEYLGESYHRFENVVVSTVIRIISVQRITSAA